MSNSRFIAFLELARPWWLVVLLPVFFSSALLANKELVLSCSFLYALASYIFLKSAVSALNDYFDRDVDEIIHPKRAIPSKRVTPKCVLIYAGILTVIALILSLFVNWIFLILEAIVVFCTILHFSRGKRIDFIPGISNIFTSVLLAFTPLVGWAAVSNLTYIAVLLFFIIFFYDLSHDTASSIRDLKGDSHGEVKTVAVGFGVKTSSALCLLFFTFSYLISLILYFLTALDLLYLIMISIGFILCFCSILVLIKKPSVKISKNTHILISLYPIILSFGIIFDILINLT